jgi:hypothetical protein
MKRALLILFAITAAAQTSGPISDRDKLSIREAELNVSEAQYALYRAQVQLQNVLNDVGKRNGCEIDPRTADCVPKPPEPPAEPPKK